MNWKPPQTILDMYRVDRVFEGGAMGFVYKVRHLHWDCDLALKKPRPKFIQSEVDVKAFEEEVESWSRLGLHPNVVTCYYSKQIEGVPCVFSEFVTGGSLSDWIRSRRLYEGDEPEVLARLLKISIQFARGLAWAHQHGIVHQDVKPGNVLMADDETAKVSDFGLARQWDGLRGADVSGFTPAYASPEQLRGTAVTPATDVWSWAASVLEMFLGGLVWDYGLAVPAVFQDYAARGHRGRGLPEMPPATVQILTRCFDISPRNRPADLNEIASQMTDEFRDLFGEDPDVEAPDPGILRADSLNNRAVSLLDVDRRTEAAQCLQAALKENPHHLEASYNAAILQWPADLHPLAAVITKLTTLSVSPAHEWRRVRALAWAWACSGRLNEARRVLEQIESDALSPTEKAEHQSVCDNLPGAAKHPPLALTPPRAASELAAKAARFRRLFPKAQAAVAEGRTNDASRYLLMLGDLPDYAMHPEVIKLRECM